MDLNDLPPLGEARKAFIKLDPAGFYLRPPPKPHELDSFITSDEHLFQTIHMGAAVVDEKKWTLAIDGMRPFSITLSALKSLSRKSVTAVHECFGSPLKPATSNLWRVGNVEWTGVPLQSLLDLARPLPSAKYIWSEGLDRGSFNGTEADRYQKDLVYPIPGNTAPLVAYEINGKPLERNRGGPIRLVVPGYLGTNSTKWLCRISLQADRAPGPFTTTYYNIPVPDDQGQGSGLMRPVWEMDVNSMITYPAPDAVLNRRGDGKVLIRGWCWSCCHIRTVDISFDRATTWQTAKVDERAGLEWQRWEIDLGLCPGRYEVIARATDERHNVQAIRGTRNHCHRVVFEVI